MPGIKNVTVCCSGPGAGPGLSCSGQVHHAPIQTCYTVHGHPLENPRPLSVTSRQKGLVRVLLQSSARVQGAAGHVPAHFTLSALFTPSVRSHRAAGAPMHSSQRQQGSPDARAWIASAISYLHFVPRSSTLPHVERVACRCAAALTELLERTAVLALACGASP